MTSKQKQRRSEALRFVNRIRKALGLPRLGRLVKGIPADPCKCSLARSLGENVKVTDSTIEFVDNPVKAHVVAVATDWWEDSISDPDTKMSLVGFSYIQKFIEDFDELLYPELVDIQQLIDERGTIYY